MKKSRPANPTAAKIAEQLAAFRGGQFFRNNQIERVRATTGAAGGAPRVKKRGNR